MVEHVKTLEEELDELDFKPEEPMMDVEDVKEEVKVETPAEPAVVEEPAPTPVVDEVAKPVSVTEVVAQPVVAPAPVEVDRVAELVKQVETLSQQILQMKSQQAQAPAPKAEPASEQPVEVFDYLGGTDIDDVTTDPKIFNTILSKMEARIRGMLAEETTRSTLLAIPDVVQYQIKQQASLDSLVNEFYESNQDLKPVKHTVAMVAQNISSEHPDWTVRQVFEESATKTREILKLNIPSGIATVTEPLKPAFADHAKAHTKQEVQLSALQKQLDEL